MEKGGYRAIQSSLIGSDKEPPNVSMKARKFFDESLKEPEKENSQLAESVWPIGKFQERISTKRDQKTL